MSKPLKFYQTLNQAPRSAKHGKHRRAGAPAYGSPVVRTDHSPGRADQGGTYTLIPWSANTFLSLGEPKPPAIPYAGIRTGELIGHRAWFVLDNLNLSSVAHAFIWKPGEIVEGQVEKEVSGNWIFGLAIFGGTYSFLAASECEKQFAGIEDNPLWSFPVPATIGFTPAVLHGVAFGTIKMWGEVIEHELGYRAQFARLHSIDRVVGAVDLEALRSKYGIPELFSVGQFMHPPTTGGGDG